MSLYTAVLFKMGEINRPIVCYSLLGSVGLATLHNMCILQYTEDVGILGPVDEKYVKSIVSLTLQAVIEAQQFDAALVSGAKSVLEEHQRLNVHPVLACPDYFRNDDSVQLFRRLEIPMLHGWVLDPEVSFYESVKDYNHAELLQYHNEIANQEDQGENLALVQGLLSGAENQLTDYGFQCLFAEIPENRFAVVFCYNRFNIVHMHQGKLFILETSMVVRDDFPGVVWRFFDGGALADNILLTAEYIPVAGQPNFDQKAAKWASVTSSQKENLTRSQKRNVQRKKANIKAKENANASSDLTRSQKRNAKKKKKIKAKENANASSDGEREQSVVDAGDDLKDDSKKDEERGTKIGEIEQPPTETDTEVKVGVIKDDIEKEVGQGTNNDGIVKPPAEAKYAVTAGVIAKDDSKNEDGQGPKKSSGSAQTEENDENLGNMSLEPLKPPAESAQGQSDVTIFLNFLLGYKHDGDSESKYFRGIVEAFKESHFPWFFVPYEFIMQYDEPFALKIQDHYPSMYEDLKKSVVQYLQINNVTSTDVRLKIIGLPKAKKLHGQATRRYWAEGCKYYR